MIKKTVSKSDIFQSPKFLGANRNGVLDLCDDATNVDLKNATVVELDKLDIEKLNSKVDKSDLYKLVFAIIDLNKLSYAVKNDVKKDVYNAKIKDIEDKILVITNLTTNTTLNAKTNEFKN